MKRLLLLLALIPVSATAYADDGRLRLIVETDAGGDPDDEQSLVRFLLYTDEWDVVGIIANRPEVRRGENLSKERTGLGLVQLLIRAYGDCYSRLREHDPRYPSSETLLERTVPGYDDTDDGVQLVIRAVDADDPRPVWFLNWGTDNGAADSCLKRALDRVLRERGPEGYAKFKKKIRLSSDDQFDEHTTRIEPPFPIWVDTFRPEVDRRRWYHRFSGLTATAGGFDIERDVRTGHGPLGALYPLNTTHPQKEGDSMTFLYLVPNGLGDPNQPGWGSWAGRYGSNPTHPGKPYYHANQQDKWNGSTHRENTLARWAADLQNDFRARLDWCVQPRDKANHPPTVKLSGEPLRQAKVGDSVTLDVSNSTDPDNDRLQYEWSLYAEPSQYDGSLNLQDSASARAKLTVPSEAKNKTLHFIAIVRDTGSPPLTRYQRVRVQIE